MKTNPHDCTTGYGFTTANGESHVNELGLTKREYFAAMALQGIISHYGVEYQKDHSKESVYFADQLIDELNK